MLIVLFVLVALVSAFVYQAHAKHNTLKAQYELDVAAAKAEVSSLKAKLADLETKVKAKL